MITELRKKYIGDKAFYGMVLGLVVPMILQNLITNFVSMLDNIMVGQIGTEQMSGVSIVNQYIFILNITIFGATAGPSIFGAQFFGKKDFEGQRHTFHFRVFMVTVIAAIYMLVFRALDAPLISLFLSEKASQEAMQTLQYGREYMKIMLVSFIPFALGQAYGSVVRECGETVVPMFTSFAAVLINLILDWGLIFGKLGMPCLGVRGAAWATVIAKILEAAILILWTHLNPERNPYIAGAYRNLKIPAALLKDMIRRGFPLLCNEFLWVIGMSVVAQCFSVRGLNVVAARNIASTISNVGSAVWVQMGSCIAIILGQMLGAGKLEEAKKTCNHLLFFCVFGSFLIMLVLVPVGFFFPKIYNTADEIKSLASFLIVAQILATPIMSYTNACYFTLRSGGRTGITFLFDFGYSWAVMIPLAFVLSYFTQMDIKPLFCIVTYAEVLKVVIGYFMVHSGMWIRNIVDEPQK